MSYFVRKIEWEYGEKYGHVFYPKSLDDLQAKLRELDIQAIENKEPFYVEIFFIDDSYLGLIVGHELSSFYFGIFVSDDYASNNCRTRFDSHYDKRKESNDMLIEYSFKAEYSEIHLAEMIPKEQALEALYQYIRIQKFPSYVHFSRQEFNDKYISAI